MSSPQSLPEALAPLAGWLATNFPGRRPRSILIEMSDGEKFPLPFDAAPAITIPLRQAESSEAFMPPEEDETFVPNAFQEAILDALDGKAMRTDPLGNAVDGRSRLFRRGGLPELREQGMVRHHKVKGFYRPDAPPPELENG